MDLVAARTNMVEGQLRPNRVTEGALVQAFQTVPREVFVPAALRSVAYLDEDLPLGGGRYLMEPMVLGRLLQAARIQPTDVVLVVGATTGYAAAICGRLAATVVALESEAALMETAQAALLETEADTVVLVHGPLEAGWPAQAPYNVILVDGGVRQVPACLLEQLADGGRLVTVLATGAGPGAARLYQKIAGSVSGLTLFDASVRALPGFDDEPPFTF